MRTGFICPPPPRERGGGGRERQTDRQTDRRTDRDRGRESRSKKNDEPLSKIMKVPLIFQIV